MLNTVQYSILLISCFLFSAIFKQISVPTGPRSSPIISQVNSEISSQSHHTVPPRKEFGVKARIFRATVDSASFKKNLFWSLKVSHHRSVRSAVRPHVQHVESMTVPRRDERLFSVISPEVTLSSLFLFFLSVQPTHLTETKCTQQPPLFLLRLPLSPSLSLSIHSPSSPSI